MALDAAIYPQDTFSYGNCKDLYTMVDDANVWSYQFGLQEDDKAFVTMVDNCMEQSLHGNNKNNNWESSSSSIIMKNVKECDHQNSSPEACILDDHQQVVGEGSELMVEATPGSSGRRKRRRTKCSKNKEELETQRMTHITVERNRRKQMNEYLAIIRSLMPASYVQRGDQASIIAGAINFVKELEHHVQTLEAQKRANEQQSNKSSPLFAEFFSFPQYSTNSHPKCSSISSSSPSSSDNQLISVENHSAALADIEVTMVESHANLKILSKKRPRQLLKIVSGLQCLWLTILHLNVSTADQMVLYSLSLKLEDGCQLTSVDEIADAVNNLLGKIQEEASLV